uniref:Uncharacterized protein n=1 Tax=Oryza barthii TaxID=65489 RepID=A0A0D3GP60_9ORYZ
MERNDQGFLTAIIKVESYFTTSLLGQRTYVKGNNVKISIERDRYSMLALVDDVGENFNWGPNQYIGFWKLGDVSTQSKVEITTDSQLLDWLDKGNQHGVAIFMPLSMILVVHCKLNLHQLKEGATHL